MSIILITYFLIQTYKRRLTHLNPLGFFKIKYEIEHDVICNSRLN